MDVIGTSFVRCVKLPELSNIARCNISSRIESVEVGAVMRTFA